jgi:hypothetical protein
MAPIEVLHTRPIESGYTKFAVIGAGAIGKYIAQELLKDKRCWDCQGGLRPYPPGKVSVQ